MVNRYDPTIGTRASAKVEDAHRMHSPGRQDQEIRLAREVEAKAYTMRLAIVVGAGFAVFVFVWWLVVH